MKKFSALLLALAMVFSLAFAAGCQQQKEAKESTAPSEENATGGYGAAPATAPEETGGYGAQ
ncbi:MAG: hypothetical protein VST72_01835 [Nitrospirota bacterium]|nr:hypothetical protein [Nitrospirota bacterium]